MACASDTLASPQRPHANADVDRAVVLNALRRLVERGLAEWVEAPNGDIELTLCSGGVYLLDNVAITRTA